MHRRLPSLSEIKAKIDADLRRERRAAAIEIAKGLAASARPETWNPTEAAVLTADAIAERLKTPPAVG